LIKQPLSVFVPCKPNSVSRQACRGGNHLSGPWHHCRGLSVPPGCIATRGTQPAWTCTPWGLPCPRTSPPGRWALTPPFHLYPPKFHRIRGLPLFSTTKGSMFSVALSIPVVAGIFLLGSTVLVGVRTFLPPTERETIARERNNLLQPAIEITQKQYWFLLFIDSLNLQLLFSFFEEWWVNYNSAAVFINNYFVFAAHFHLGLRRQRHTKGCPFFHGYNGNSVV